jgi:BMFP domain-containing protein YqiC
MHAHFTSFTSEAMRAFGQELAADGQRRRELLAGMKRQTGAFLSDFRAAHRAAAEQAADGRRVLMSELRSGAHALRTRFDLARREMSDDLRQMATERRAASEAFRNRPGRHADLSSRTTARPAALAGGESDGPARRPWHPKKRHEG